MDGDLDATMLPVLHPDLSSRTHAKTSDRNTANEVPLSLENKAARIQEGHETLRLPQEHNCTLLKNKATRVQEGHKICDVLKNPPRPTNGDQGRFLTAEGGGRFKKTTKPATSSRTHFQESYSDQGSPLPLQNRRTLAANKVAPLLLPRTGAQEKWKGRKRAKRRFARERSRRKIRMESKSRLDDGSRGNDRHGSSCFLELHYRVLLSPTKPNEGYASTQHTFFLSR